MSRYSNKRAHVRAADGKFRRLTMRDFGVGGVCPTCNHFLLRHYDGDPRDTSPDPRLFRYRCFTCEPATDAETKLAAEIEATKPKPLSILDILKASEK